MTRRGKRAEGKPSRKDIPPKLHFNISHPPPSFFETDTHTQFDSFVPVWAYDEPKQKKKKVKSSSKKSKSEKSGQGEESQSQGKSSATEINGTQQGLSQRQGATVEEIDDDEA